MTKIDLQGKDKSKDWNTMKDEDSLSHRITILWERIQRGEILEGRDEREARECLREALDALTEGRVSVVQRPSEDSGDWSINTSLKQAILLAFRFFSPENQGGLPLWWDKIPLLQNSEDRWKREGIRLVPGAFVRHGAHLSPSCIIMPSFINMGAWIGKGSMIDGGAHIGSCAFIGDHCHVSANVTIGGVLEPLQALPVILEDHVFIGAGCHVVEGMHIGEGSVLGAGVVLTSSTKIIDRATGEHLHGPIPPHSVLIPGSYATGVHGLSIACAILTKKTVPGQSPKTALTEALRR